MNNKFLQINLKQLTCIMQTDLFRFITSY